ncbi:hypothetical protein JKP88DRAFT_301502 [Tribonema minus]|uniref:PAS fold-3 domain-containing protein n=1 Tax=Tribonema minus TaxID=303371 RepID=A0A836CK30_9STRA|nr:hypothetical protein JKP88DRAFT_301502 [Tribonema minus]
MATTWEGMPFNDAAAYGAAAGQQCGLQGTPDAGLDAFDQTLSAISDCELQLAWQNMLQQQHRILQQQQQMQMSAPFFPSSIASFYPFPTQPQLPPSAVAAAAFLQQPMSSCQLPMQSTIPTPSPPPASWSRKPERQRQIVPEPTAAAPITISDAGDNSNSLKLKEEAPRALFANSFSSAASAASEHYYVHEPTTSCDDSDGCDEKRAITRKRIAIDAPSDISLSGSSPRNGSSLSGEDEEDDPDSACGGKRKRKPYWRQTWYKERNKEYSRNWRSKKKQEEETLRSEIAELRAYRRLVEETLDMHVHDAAPDGSYPLTYASPGLLRLLALDAADAIVGGGFMALVHADDRAAVRAAFDKVATLGQLAEVTYRFRHPATGAQRHLHSTLRNSEKGVLAVTTGR